MRLTKLSGRYKSFCYTERLLNRNLVPVALVIHNESFVSCPHPIPATQGSAPKVVLARSPVAPLLTTTYFICMCSKLPVTKATRDGTCAVSQAFLPSAIAFLLTSFLWQQEVHVQQNPSPYVISFSTRTQELYSFL